MHDWREHWVKFPEKVFLKKRENIKKKEAENVRNFNLSVVKYGGGK